MDPAALGTTRIGLDGIRREHERYERGDPVQPRSRPRGRGIRHLAAATLRRVAARLEPVSQPAG